MAREKLNSDDTELLDVNSEVKRLNREKSNLIIENNQLIEKNSKLKEEQIALINKGKEIIDNAQAEAQKIKDDASALYAKVKDGENQLNSRIGEHTEKEQSTSVLEKEAQDLIKSNKGLQENLSAQSISLENKVKKLSALVDLIKETIKDI